jgi:hypothetical protein
MLQPLAVAIISGLLVQIPLVVLVMLTRYWWFGRIGRSHAKTPTGNQ